MNVEVLMYNGKRWPCEPMVVVAGNKEVECVALDWSPGLLFCPHTFKNKWWNLIYIIYSRHLEAFSSKYAHSEDLPCSLAEIFSRYGVQAWWSVHLFAVTMVRWVQLVSNCADLTEAACF